VTPAGAEEPPRPGTTAAERARRDDPFDSDRAVRVITAEEIWRTNARNLPDLLRQELGAWMTFANYAGGSPILRGVRGNDILVLLDGIEINNTAYRFGDLEYLSMIDLFLLERIEIVGGASGVWGGDTIGPVIRLYSKRDAAPLAPGAAAPETSAARAFFRYSTVDKSSIAHVEGHREQEGYALLFGLTTRDIGDLKGGGRVGFQRVTGYEEVAGNARLDWFLSESRTLEIGAQIHEQQNVTQHDRIEGGSHLDFELDPRKRTYFGLSYLDDTDRSWSDQLEATLYLQQHRERAFEQLTERPEIRTQTSDNDDTLGLRVKAYLRLGTFHRLGYGLVLSDESVSAVRREIDVLTGEEISRGKDAERDGIGREQIAVWLEDRIELSPALVLRVGGRYSSYSVSGTQENAAGVFPLDADGDGLSAYVGLRWQPVDGLRLFGGYDHGFRLPGIDEITGHTPREGVNSLPNPALDVPTVDAFELGLHHRSGRATVELALFRQEIADAPVLVPATPPPLPPAVALPGPGTPRWVRSENGGEARIEGVELSFDLALPLDLSLGGTLVSVEGENAGTGEPLAGIPPLYGTLALRWSGPWTWEPWAEALYRYSAEKDRLSPAESLGEQLDPASLASWDTFTLRAGLTLPPRLRLVFSLENPADEAYLPYGSLLWAPGRNLALTAEYVF
jgi:outer membrane receptor protein involved in Fe transport